MLKYRGQYRVVNEIDSDIYGKCESNYTPCSIKKGSQMYRYSETELRVYIPSVTIGNRLMRERPDLFRLFVQSDFETVLCFDESRIIEAASILRPWTKGKNISPRSKKNSKFRDE